MVTIFTILNSLEITCYPGSSNNINICTYGYFLFLSHNSFELSNSVKLDKKAKYYKTL